MLHKNISEICANAMVIRSASYMNVMSGDVMLYVHAYVAPSPSISQVIQHVKVAENRKEKFQERRDIGKDNICEQDDILLQRLGR